MNWKLIGLLSGFGVLMGVASVLGFTAGIEGLLWLVIGLICMTAVVWKAPGRRFRHGFFVGLMGGTMAPLIQVLFFPTYLSNDPGLGTRFAEVPGGMDARYFVLLLAPVIGLVSGLALGMVCWTIAALFGRGRMAASRDAKRL